MFKISESQAKERLGQVVINKQGERMKIIKYNNSRDIDCLLYTSDAADE